MTKLEQTVKNIHTVDDADRKYIGKGAIAPISRFLMTFFILAVISFDKETILLVAGKVICKGKTNEILSDRTLLEEHGLELPLCNVRGG